DDLSADGPVARNLPIGQRIYRTVVELETAAAGTVGEKVDIAHVTLGDEGPVAKTILRGILVVSNKPTTGAASDVVPAAPMEPPADDTATTEPADHPEFYETRLVGLAVTGGQLEWLRMAEAQGVLRIRPTEVHEAGSLAEELLHNFVTNLFQPLLLFFFMGFLVPILKVPFEFPKALYQSLVIYLLIAIGWHGGELMAHLSPREIAVAGGLAAVGFVTNAFIGYLATVILKRTTRMRQIDAVTVGAYYGSDSAGTFVTCLGILSMLSILHDSYMPVMLAVMEIPGCLIGLFLISRLRRKGMDPAGNMPGEAGYTAPAKQAAGSESILSPKILHEVFLNPGLFMLFGGIVVGFISGVQALKDPSIVEGPNHLFLFIFKGALCLFLL
ncbi:MAG: sodium-dependent bicarbonate transport family permease, partial [Pirellulales bacterium]